MSASFFFYDLETSGVNPRDARVMQFAGQRTDMDLKPIGEPENILIRMTEDVLPDPDAILITGITPQQTIQEGITEAKFLKYFHEKIALPGTIFTGFNSVRFDDEFMRYLLYRNFYDPYEWQYQDGRSRWDLLDVVRMTRALRPEGIIWPVVDGKPANRLELLSAANGIEHSNAHDALSDVRALIDLTALIKRKQPKLFDYLLQLRDKNRAFEIAMSRKPFLYTSGKYQNEFEKTTAVTVLSEHPKRQGVLVYDLRYDPTPYADMTPQVLAEAMRRIKDDPGPRLPVKTLQFNRCPAIAPMGVLDESSQERLKLDPKAIEQNFQKLQALTELPGLVRQAVELMDSERELKYLEQEADIDARLYDGFFEREDKTKMSVVRAADEEGLSSLSVAFKDERLNGLLPLYKARNFPRSLSDEDRAAWEQFRIRRLTGGKEKSRVAKFFNRLAALASDDSLTDQQRYLLGELQLYGESTVPLDVS